MYIQVIVAINIVKLFNKVNYYFSRFATKNMFVIIMSYIICVLTDLIINCELTFFIDYIDILQSGF